MEEVKLLKNFVSDFNTLNSIGDQIPNIKLELIEHEFTVMSKDKHLTFELSLILNIIRNGKASYEFIQRNVSTTLKGYSESKPYAYKRLLFDLMASGFKEYVQM